MRQFRNSLAKAALIAVIGLLTLISCGEEKGPTGSGGVYFLQKLYPRNHSVGVSPAVNFTWRPSDSIGGNVNYIIYLDSVYPPGLFDTVGIDTSYRFASYGYLCAGKTYFWKIKAFNDSGKSIVSDIWQFKVNDNYIFPIAVGNRWSYTETFNYYNFEPDSIRFQFWEPISISGNCEITGTIDFVDSPSVYVFHYDWSDGNYSFGEYDKYMANRQTGLFYYGNSGSPTWLAPPKTGLMGQAVFEFNGRTFPSIRNMIDYFVSDQSVPRQSSAKISVDESHPICELQYPLEIGREWIYRSRALSDSWEMKKVIVRMVDRPTDFGTIKCYEIKWFWDIDGDGKWDTNIEGYDYVSQIGTVARVFKFYGATLQNYSGEILGTYDFTETYLLTSYYLSLPDYIGDGI